MNIPTQKTARLGALVAAAMSAVAVGAPLVQAARAVSQDCRDTTGWVTVTDAQGVPWLEPAGQAGCTTTAACTTVAYVAALSPYPGWVSVTDDTGVPFLYPVGASPASYGPQCEQPQTAPAADAVTDGPASAAMSSALPSPYPGWVTVIDDLGIPWLVPVSQPGG